MNVLARLHANTLSCRGHVFQKPCSSTEPSQNSPTRSSVKPCSSKASEQAATSLCPLSLCVHQGPLASAAHNHAARGPAEGRLAAARCTQATTLARWQEGAHRARPSDALARLPLSIARKILVLLRNKQRHYSHMRLTCACQPENATSADVLAMCKLRSCSSLARQARHCFLAL